MTETIPTTENLPALISRASQRLSEARSSGELLETRQLAQAALHYAKVSKAANETKADCLRIILRAEMRLAHAVDEEQVNGEVRTAGRHPNSPQCGQLDEIGISSQRLTEWRELRDAGEEAVEAAIESQIAEGKAPTKSGVQALLAGLTACNEWYTPAEWVERARQVMGGIDVDPATSAAAQQTIRATQWFDKEIDGLKQKWRGNVWLNPPYSRTLIDAFIGKLITESSAISQAIVLTDARTDTRWFHALCSISGALAFTRGRIHFYNETAAGASPVNGSSFAYIGGSVERFEEVFGVSCAVLRRG